MVPETQLKKFLLLLLLAAVAVLLWGIVRKSEPPTVNFARAKRQTLVSTLPTNGKVEPIEWQSVRAETAGLVGRVSVSEGAAIQRGAEMVALTDPALQSAIDAAEARVSEARANLLALESGGKPVELTEIENSLAQAQLELDQQTREREALERLVARQAATQAELRTAEDKIRQTRLVIEGLKQRRASLVAKPELTAASARLRDAEVALNLARQRASRSVIRAPLSGIVYNLAARPGSFLNTGDLIANVGRMDRVRVRVYVDEPELGRVAEGQPVTITWQALPGKKWMGTVERKPASIQALGSRQVGEVVCTIENSDRRLLPGTNVDAEIRTAVVDNALVIPREALRRDARVDYVFVLRGDVVERRDVKPGVSSIAQVQIVDGLAEGDAVALPSQTPISAGSRVTPVVAPR
jgi:HlyD family secretion protein